MNLIKEKNWFQIFSSSEEDLASVRLQTAFRDNFCKWISVDMALKWKCLQLIKNRKDLFLAGLEQLLCPQWGSLISGLYLESSTRKMELYKSKNVYDEDISLFIYYPNMMKYHFFWRMLKKYYTYKIPSSGRSVQWTPFFALSLPYTARKDLGRTVLAIYGSWGPHNYLNEGTTFSCLI